MQPTRYLIVQYLILINSLLLTFSEYFTSSIHLNGLLQKELNLRDQVRDYINEKELRLEKLKTFYMNRKDTEKYVSTGNVSSLVGHPLFLFSCINRMWRSWQRVQSLTNTYDSMLSSIYKERPHFPSNEDLSGAKSALIRLQETFALPTREIMDGLEPDGGVMPKLDVVDAYHIGYHAFRQNKPHQSISWMREVLRILNLNTTKVDFNITKARFEAMDVLSWAEYHTDNLLTAYKYALELIKIEPSNERIIENLELIKEAINEERIPVNNETIESADEGLEPEELFASKLEEPYQPFYYLPEEDETKRYEVERARANALCRGETDPVPVKYRKYLLCWYKTDHPLLILKPGKAERLYPRPEIIMFRGILTESEMDRIKELARPVLKRATVNNPNTGKLESANYRVSKSAWLSRKDDPTLVKTMNNLIDAFTGLDMKYAEEVQVANYGIGGFYEPHFDFARIVPVRPPPWTKRDNYTHQKISRFHARNTDSGERIATILFYMSEVESGGATVFTNIGQAVTPSKGDAVFWYNLMHDGSGDYETRHAACPVFIGEKWICNRWLHEYGQEFRRQCKLRHDDDWW